MSDNLPLLYKISRALLSEQDYGELLAGLLDAARQAGVARLEQEPVVRDA